VELLLLNGVDANVRTDIGETVLGTLASYLSYAAVSVKFPRHWKD